MTPLFNKPLMLLYCASIYVSTLRELLSVFSTPYSCGRVFLSLFDLIAAFMWTFGNCLTNFLLDVSLCYYRIADDSKFMLLGEKTFSASSLAETDLLWWLRYSSDRKCTLVLRCILTFELSESVMLSNSVLFSISQSRAR